MTSIYQSQIRPGDTPAVSPKTAGDTSEPVPNCQRVQKFQNAALEPLLARILIQRITVTTSGSPHYAAAASACLGQRSTSSPVEGDVPKDMRESVAAGISWRTSTLRWGRQRRISLLCADAPGPVDEFARRSQNLAEPGHPIRHSDPGRTDSCLVAPPSLARAAQAVSDLNSPRQ